jgi:hypothetical protein
MSLAEILKMAGGSLRRFPNRAPRWLEDVGVLAAAFLATLHAEWRIISDPLVFQQDAEIHEFWMRRFQDGALFHDPLTNALVATGYVPPGIEFLYWLASHAIDPVAFGEILALVLQPLSVWLLFRIVRVHTAWRPAAWIGAALFLVPWDILRFSGGHSRAFAQPIVLLTLLLQLQRRRLAAAIVPPLGFAFYPPAALAALGLLVVSAADRDRRWRVDTRRLTWAVISLVLFAGAAVVLKLAGKTGDFVTLAQAHRYPEFGPDGHAHYFTDSTLAYLTNNYSGFALRASGSILAVTAIVLLTVRPRTALLLRWEVWSMAIASLALYAVAQALLFRLYLPQRYTYPLLPFFCVVIAVGARPTLEALARRNRIGLLATPGLVVAVMALALLAFPVGPRLSVGSLGSWLSGATPYLVIGLVVGLLFLSFVLAGAVRQGTVRPPLAAAAVVLAAGSVLIGAVTFAGGGESFASACGDRKVYRHVRKLPKDAIIAGDPILLDCIPIAARRSVVISRKLYQPWDVAYLKLIRPRMFLTVAAVYGPSIKPIVELRKRYGADYLLVAKRRRKHAWPGMAPFTGQLERLLQDGRVPAALRLPGPCKTWESRHFELYDLGCVATEAKRSSAP